MSEFIYNLVMNTFLSMTQNPEVKWKMIDPFAQKSAVFI